MNVLHRLVILCNKLVPTKKYYYYYQKKNYYYYYCYYYCLVFHETWGSVNKDTINRRKFSTIIREKERSQCKCE